MSDDDRKRDEDDLMKEGEDLLGLDEDGAEHSDPDDVEAPEEADSGEIPYIEQDSEPYAHELVDPDHATEHEIPPPATWAGQQAQSAGESEPPEQDSAEFEPVSEEQELEPPSEEFVAEEVEAEPPSEELEAEPPSEETQIVPPGSSTEPMPKTHIPQPVPPPVPVEQAAGPTPAQGAIPPGMSVTAQEAQAMLPDDDGKPPKSWLWPRFLAAALVIVISMAAATSTSALLFLTDFAGKFNIIRGITAEDLPESDGAQTILILGSDVRPGEKIGRSDTTMLVRLDADRNLISLLSLPRDLEVNIPGYGVDKLNAAYSYGGPPLTLKTVSELTGLDINHLVNVDFSGFAKAVDAIDCVYVDVDRHYFHTNEGLYGEEQYSEIDIDSGYQRLCGPDALAYVRYRHEDNDIIRGARQQDFLREARAKVDPESIWSNKNEYLDIFTQYTTTDIHAADTLIQLLKLFITLRDADVQKIEFHGDIGDATSTYVTTSDQQLRTAIAKFLGQDSDGGAAVPAAEPSKGKGGGGDGGGGGGTPSLVDTNDSAQAFGSEFANNVHFDVYLPRQLPAGSTFSDDSHSYGIDTPDATYGAYKLVVSYPGPYGVPEYYGVEGTKWLDPPLLRSPSELRTINGQTYQLFYDGGRLRLVGWKTDEASYWVNNTLTHSLDENEMLAIAESMRESDPIK